MEGQQAGVGDGLVEATQHATVDAILEACPETFLSLAVSIDGPPAVHDRIRDQEGAHARALASLDRYLEDHRNLNLDYLAACYEGDEILVANWVVTNDGKLRATRRFQLINRTRGQVAMRGEILYVCMNLKSGRPVRMPEEFLQAYQPETKVPGR